MHFSGICLQTDDVRALAAFYAAVFHAQPSGDDTHAEIALPGLAMAIFSRAGMEDMVPGSMDGAGWGGVTLMFAVEDVDAEYERLKELGVCFILHTTTHPWGARSFWFRDPDGNIVDFYSRVE